jgi:hypothetical protein
MNPSFRHHGPPGWFGDSTDDTAAAGGDNLFGSAGPWPVPSPDVNLLVGPAERDSAQPAGSPAVSTAMTTPSAGPVVSASRAAGLVIDVTYDNSVASLATTDPATFAAYEAAVQTAVQYYESVITNPITVTIAFGWGETMGTPIIAGAVGESIAYEDLTNYGSLYTALTAADTTSAVQAAAAASLPAADPTGGATFEVTTAEANLLGLYPANQYVGGFVGLDSTAAWSWSQGSVASNTEDAVGTLEHEISEVLGRADLAGSKGYYTPLDLFRYTAADGGATAAPGSAAGVRDEPFVAGYSANANSYFSYDGKTVTLPYETPSDVANGADVADWAPSVSNDSYADDAPDGANVVSATDLTEMNVLGYDLACYAAGTRIATVSDAMPVEALRPGDLVRTVFGGSVPVLWVGERRIVCGDHPNPAAVWPVRVAANAFEPGVPHRDLVLSPNHAVFTDGVLIPVKHLINGSTIARIKVDQVTYHHVELARHDVLLAEGLPAESYLDTGNRGMFARGHGPVPLSRTSRARQAVAPLATDEARVRPVWQRLAARAGALGATVPAGAFTSDPAVTLLVDGRTVRPVEADPRRGLFVMPPGAAVIQLASRSGYPTDTRPWADDWRQLGVYVSRIVWHDRDGRTDMPVDDPSLRRGWWSVECADDGRLRRWTDGAAFLTPPDGVTMVEIEWEGGMTYRDRGIAPDPVAGMARAA